jgi:ABC-type thiamine transport system ATPase subunit
MTDLALETTGLGKQFGSRWALRTASSGCPRAGYGSSAPTAPARPPAADARWAEPASAGAEIFGGEPSDTEAFVRDVGYLAQEIPLYRRWTVADHLTFGARLNPGWDDDATRERLDRLRIPFGQRVDTLSGGQRAQVALALALGKKPRLLLLDEPVAALDPLARRQFLTTLTGAVADGNLTVILSSHLCRPGAGMRSRGSSAQRSRLKVASRDVGLRHYPLTGAPRFVPSSVTTPCPDRAHPAQVRRGCRAPDGSTNDRARSGRDRPRLHGPVERCARHRWGRLMTWLLWRQHRLQAGIAAAAYAGFMVAILLTGWRMAHIYHSAMVICRADDTCGDLSLFQGYGAIIDRSTRGRPLLIGLFSGSSPWAERWAEGRPGPDTV